MKANSKFLSQPLEFWANVKLISQKVGYTERGTSKVKIPNVEDIVKVYSALELNYSRIIENDTLTKEGALLLEYFKFRAEFLNDNVEANLMNVEEAAELYQKLNKEFAPTCPIPQNKQTGAKSGPAYFTSIINILIEANSKGYPCDYDPRELSAFTQDNFPVRSLSRRVDGAFPNVINPIALWEIKEYYYTTTFGSRIADGVYETLLDGFELAEAREFLNRQIHHYLMVDDYNTWWKMGRSYLCRICDMLHMGFITEVLFGKEVVERVPVIVKEWIQQHDNNNSSAPKKPGSKDRELNIKREK
jgi:hypothetical protein